MKIQKAHLQGAIIIAIILALGTVAGYFIAVAPYRYPPFEQVKAAGITSMTEFEFRQLPPDVQAAYVRQALTKDPAP